MKLYGRLAAHRYAALLFTAATTTVAADL